MGIDYKVEIILCRFEISLEESLFFFFISIKSGINKLTYLLKILTIITIFCSYLEFLAF